MRILYRASQFWNTVRSRPASQDIIRASQALAPDLMRLFSSMQPGEQSHSLVIYKQLLKQGETDQDLLAAALLHDVGKTRCPLQAWERAVIVLVKAALPNKARQWGKGQPSGWRRPFVVSEQHPAWGAEMAAKAGATDTVVSLIRRHQEERSSKPGVDAPIDRQDALLLRLQLIDNES